MLTARVGMLSLTGPAESEGELSTGLVAEEGEEESARRIDSALDQPLVRFCPQVSKALGDDGGMPGRELSGFADPRIPEAKFTCKNFLKNDK